MSYVLSAGYNLIKKSCDIVLRYVSMLISASLLGENLYAAGVKESFILSNKGKH